MKLYAANVTALYDESIFQKNLQKVSTSRRIKALKYRNVKDRALSLGAELLLNFAVSALYGNRKLPLEFGTNENEKPYLKDYPSLYFNLSHSGEFVVCGIDLENEIGVDIEMVGRFDTDTARCCFFGEEFSYFESKSGDERAEAFFTMWVLKESYMKAIGKGFAIELSDFSIEPSAISENTVTVGSNGGGKEHNCRLYDIHSDYRMAVCSKSKSFPDTVNIVDII